jgi:hypothetical protein
VWLAQVGRVGCGSFLLGSVACATKLSATHITYVYFFMAILSYQLAWRMATVAVLRDHGSLTGLTAAMFASEDGHPTDCPDPQAGLYVKARAGQLQRVLIPEGHIAYQLGEVAQVSQPPSALIPLTSCFQGSHYHPTHCLPGSLRWASVRHTTLRESAEHRVHQ